MSSVSRFDSSDAWISNPSPTPVCVPTRSRPLSRWASTAQTPGAGNGFVVSPRFKSDSEYN